MHKIAVYGTLRKGRGNHGLLGNSNFVGKGFTKEKYQMFSSSGKTIGDKFIAQGIPFVRDEIAEGYEPIQITVEVYEVDDETLRVLDRLEGHPNWYVRKPLEVIINGDIIEAELYFYNTVTPHYVPSGDFCYE